MATSVISKEELERFIDLGLGRGIDMTIQSPWQNKSAFQVRNVTADSVIGTEEGGFVHDYNSSTMKTADQQAKLKASLAVPNTPLSIGLETEISSKSNYSLKIVGSKIINRTVSFRSGDLDLLSESDSESTNGDQQKPHNQESTLNFEEILSSWILNEIQAKQATSKKKSEEFTKRLTKEPITTNLKTYLNSKDLHDENEANKIVEMCTDFVRSFGVTHYVNSITLGASEHSVMTKAEYARSRMAAASVNALQQVSAQASVKASQKVTRSSMDKTCIGTIVDKKVERGKGEAVIGIKVLPVNSLIHKSRVLKLALQKALIDYNEEKIKEEEHYDSFLVECGDSKMYWSVQTSDNTLTITKNIEEASVFYVIPCESSEDDPYDFHLGWRGECHQDILEMLNEDKEKQVNTKIMRYLQVETNWFGNNPGPLKIKSEVESKNSVLYVYSPIVSGFFGEAPIDITDWTKDKTACFVSSAHRKGFIAVHQVGDHYTTKCVSSHRHHNEKDHWMLFRLLPSGKDYNEGFKINRDDKIESNRSKIYEELTSLIKQ